MTTIALAHTQPANRGASFFLSTTEVAARTIRKFVRTPQLIVVGTATGVLFLLIFRYVFGGAVGHIGASVSYVDFLVPGFVTTSVLFAGMGSSAGVAEDIQAGLVDRLRSLPISRLSVVAGRVLADTALTTWTLFVTTVVGFLVGFRIHNGLAPALAAFGLCVVYGVAFDWLFVSGGLYAGNAQAAQGLSFLVFPLTFVSSAYVPVSTMPGWMQGIARVQPITAMCDTVRILTQGPSLAHTLPHPLHWYLLLSLAWSALLLAIFVPVSLRKFKTV
jgi:ABC-2 type transport system permease protein